MIISWIILVGIVIVMYILLYKYEKRIDKLEKTIKEHKDIIDNYHKLIHKNKNILEKHDNRIEQMWVTLPKIKDNDESNEKNQ